jgi:hypothetical protein
MDRLHFRRLLARTAASFGALLCAWLLWLALLDWFWLPSRRTLRVDYRCATSCTLSWTPDIGRGFLYLDSASRELAGTSDTTLLELPQTSARVRLEFRGGHGSIVKVSELTSGGSVTLARAEGARSVHALPLLRQRLPRSAGIFSALAVTALGVALFTIRARRRIAGLGAILSSKRFATLPGFVLAAMLMLGALFVTASAADAYHVIYRRIDNPPYWPVSLFDPLAFSPRMAAGALLLVLSAHLALAVRAEARRTTPLPAIAIGLTGLVLGNLLQGWELGFVEPTAGDQTYFSESRGVGDAFAYLGNYAERQGSLGTHARTHPPGAVLLYYVLGAIVPNPGALSLLLGSAAFALALLNVFAIARRYVNARAAAFATLVFALLPSVQIYFIVSLEAVVCALTTGAVRYFLDPRPLPRWLGTTAYGALALFLSFGAVFLVPVLAAFELATERSARRTLVIGAIIAAVFAALYGLTGFDWLSSLHVATRIENPHGFWLPENPASYLFTRLEGIAEVLLFASPLVLVGAVHAFRSRDPKTQPLRRLCAVAIGTFLAMLATGAFKTGETARACLFVAPFLVLPLAALDHEKRLGESRRTLLSSAVFAQSVLMQLTGQYYW